MQAISLLCTTQSRYISSVASGTSASGLGINSCLYSSIATLRSNDLTLESANSRLTENVNLKVL